MRPHREREQESRWPCSAHPFRVETHKQFGLVYVRISGDFDGAVVGRVQSALDESWDWAVRRVVFDLNGVTFLDARALAAILHADNRGRRDGFDVVVVRPPALVGRVFTLTKAADQLKVVDHAWELNALAGRIQFAGLTSDDIPDCVRCRISPAAWEGGDIVDSRVMLVSAQDGPICRGCATRAEQIELGEAILGQLRGARPQGHPRIGELEAALAELRRTEQTPGGERPL